jgi:hypothetical protein
MKAIRNYGVFYSKQDFFSLIEYSDSNWERNVIDRQSTIGYICQLGSSQISWSNKRLRTISFFMWSRVHGN